MAAVSQRASGIPQPISKARGPSRLTSMQSQFQQREAADRQKKLAQLAPSRAATSETTRPEAATARTATFSGARGAAPPAAEKTRQTSAAARGRATSSSDASSTGSVPASAGTRGPGSSGGGKVRAMFQSRRAGTAAQTSPVGWDKSYPLEPIRKAPPSRAAAAAPPVLVSAAADAADGSLRRALSEERLEGSQPAPPAATMRNSVTAPDIRVDRASPTRRERGAERSRIASEMRRRERDLLSRIKNSYPAMGLIRPLKLALGRSRPTAAAARPRRAEAPEPRRREPPRAAPAPAAAAAPARPPPTAPARPPLAAKENQRPATEAPRPPPTDPNLAQCPICSRAFAKDRLDKHRAICEKSSKKKRKVFDPVKMRVKGTESESYLKKAKNKKAEVRNVHLRSQAAPAPAKKDWRKQHEEFIRNIRAAKKAQAHLAAGGKLEDLPPPPPMDTSDYVSCPHCNRRFNEAAADRHIPKCANISSNKPVSGGARKPAARAAPARLRR